MSSKVQLDDIVDITYTAAPKSGGLSLSKAELTRAFNLRQITISTDPLTRNQWVSLWAKGSVVISEKILGVRLNTWRWRKVGTDKADPDEISRFRATLRINKNIGGEFPSESLPPLDDSSVTPPIPTNITVHANPKVLTSLQAAPRSPPLPKSPP
ncbi:hypothetical protein FRB90_006835, partial [Tulasnella sp. 427]